MANRVIVVLGMDRSGTSLCANLLNRLGMRLGPDLLPGDRFNEEGYFEDKEIWSIHERIFAVLGRSWDTLTTIRPFPPLWWHTEGMQRFKAQMIDLVRARISEGPGFWGFKDPRTAMLLPLWDDVFQACDVQPVFALCVRHPAGVAASLAARDGFPRSFSELLWLERNLNACQAIHDLPHCLVHYENWFRDPRRQAKTLIEVTGLTPPNGTAELTALVSGIVHPRLRHDKPDDQAVGTAATREFYAHLRHLTKAPGEDVLRAFADGLETARDCTAVAQQLNGRVLEASMQSPSCQECTVEDMEVIYCKLPPTEGASSLERDQAFLMTAASALTADLPALPTFPLFNFDNVAGIATPLEKEGRPAVPVGQHGNLEVTGWAVDRAAAKPVSAVEILIDGVPFRATTYGIERPDIAAHFGVKDYLPCGFAFTMQARLLSRGFHILAARLVSADGSRYQQSPELPIMIHVEATNHEFPPSEAAGNLERDQALLRSAASALTAHLPALPTFPLFNFDRVGEAATPLETEGRPPVPVGQYANLEVIGWAVDGEAAKPASAVEIVIDGIPFRARYGIERPDIAAHFGVEDYLRCGFAFTMKARLLSRGLHFLGARLVSADGSRYQKSPDLPILVV